jgi:hypothetical protein
MAKPHEVPAEFEQYGKPVKSYSDSFMFVGRTFWIFDKGVGMQSGKKKPEFAAWDEIKEVKGEREIYPNKAATYMFYIYLKNGERLGWFGPSDKPAISEFGLLLIAIVEKYKKAKLELTEKKAVPQAAKPTPAPSSAPAPAPAPAPTAAPASASTSASAAVPAPASPAVKAIYVLALTAKKEPPAALAASVQVTEKILKESNPAFAQLFKEKVQPGMSTQAANVEYAGPTVHTPPAMQLMLAGWIKKQYGANFKPAANVNFFRLVLRNTDGKESHFLYYFDMDS